MAEDLLEAEQVATVEQVELGERVAERMRVGPHAVEPGPPAEPAQGVLDRRRGERPPVAGQEDVIDVAADRARAAVGEVVRQAGLGHGPEGNEPLLAALASDPEVAVGEQVADPQTGELGQPQPRVEEQRDDQPIAARGDRQESLQLDRSERPDESRRNLRTGQTAERILGDETLRGAPGRGGDRG
jgi:hypothetical protein